MVFDQNGQLVSFKGKTIHSLNKNEHALDMAAPLHDRLGEEDGVPINEFSLVKKRTNVLRLGDHIGDLGMSDGLNFETRISVGFLLCSDSMNFIGFWPYQVLTPFVYFHSVYTLLNVLELNSSMKQLSVTVKYEEGKLLLICKGDDSYVGGALDVVARC